MNKKGQGLPLNVIIIAAIVLIVLVVLWAIFTGRMGVFSKGLADVTKGSSCTDLGGQKKTELEGGCGDTKTCERIYGNFKDIGAGEMCCRPVGFCGGAPGCDLKAKESECSGKNCTWTAGSCT